MSQKHASDSLLQTASGFRPLLRRADLFKDKKIRVDDSISKSRTVQARIVSGSAVLLSGSALTAVLNFAYNLVVARWLGEIGFAHATVVYTLLTILSAVTLSFQIVAAKAVAQQTAAEAKAAVYRAFHRASWVCGLLVAAFLIVFRQGVANYVNLPSPQLITLLAAAAAFYVPLGSRRGYIQGACSFVDLAANLVLEGAVRLGASMLLMLLGYGVPGVVLGNAIAMAVAYAGAQTGVGIRLSPRVPNPLRLSQAMREMSQALVFFAGQVLINNYNIVLVKHFFPASAAGIYSAAAIAGRVIYALSSAVVNSTFPIVAGASDEGRRDLRVIATSLMLVVGIGSTISLGLFLAPNRIWVRLLGAGFESAGQYHVSHLLALYAITTVVYSLSAVIISFEMSYKIAHSSWIQFAFCGALIAGICLYHSTLTGVILVQLVLLAAMFVFVALPFLISSLTDPKDLLVAGMGRPIHLIRRVSEDEVIAEFLKSDFHSHTYQKYQETLRQIVAQPNLEDPVENSKRRTLLFIKHFALWQEIPAGTKWHEVEVNEADLGDIRVFPRAQWRKLARGNFSVTQVAQAMRTRRDLMDTQFLAKIAAIGDRFANDEARLGAVILIGRDETEPLTVLDGNHRLAAAILRTPSELGKLRFLCGLSPQMTSCCWYNTNLANLFRYGRNVIVQAIRNPEAGIASLLKDPGPESHELEA